jgi:predicted ATPase
MIEKIRENRATLTFRLTDMLLRIEGGLRANDLLFLDRGFPDCLAYCRVAGLNPNAFLSECFHHRYASVFMLDRLPYQRDGVRAADDATAEFLDEWIARDYAALGYKAVRVPVLSPEERLAFVVESLSERHSPSDAL